MVANLAARGIELQTLATYGSLEAQRERLRGYGFGDGGGGGGGGGGGASGGGVRARDVDECWEEGVPAEEKQRVGGLEMIDEVEEWRLLAQHYCVAWGWRDDGAEKGRQKQKEEGAEAEAKAEGIIQNESESAAPKTQTEKSDNDNDVWKQWREINT